MGGKPRPVLIRGAAPYGEQAQDLLLAGGVIAAVGAQATTDPRAADAEIVDGAGFVLLPGLVDLHTHLREPGREDAEPVSTVSRAAALGGYTAVFAMPNTDPTADTAGVVEQVYRMGREVGLVDVHPIGAVTVGRKGERLAELAAMAYSAARLPPVHRGLGGGGRRGEEARHHRHFRGHPASPAAHRRAGGWLRPGVQGQPAIADRIRYRRAAAGARPVSYT